MTLHYSHLKLTTLKIIYSQTEIQLERPHGFSSYQHMEEAIRNIKI